MLADPDVQAVILCTPTRTHAALVRQAMHAGKHVLCEKPLCDSLDDAEDLQMLAARTGCLLAVAYIYRHAPRMAMARRFLTADSFGNPARPIGEMLAALLRAGGRGDESRWKHQRADGGGAINEMLVHMIDLGTWMFGACEDIRLLSSTTLRPERSIEGVAFRPDAEDFVLARVECRDGFEYFIEADLATPAFVQYLDVVGENGNLFTSIVPDFPSYIFLRSERAGYPAGRREIEGVQSNYYVPQIEAFLDAMRGLSAPALHTIDDSVEVMRLIDALSRQQGDVPPPQGLPRSVSGGRHAGRRSLGG